ncbi:hypothetical protein IAQ67_28710 (plasmid) [Paenibacillus peoriae]|uniref:Uncharacterized protein n=1 Tax=Paenibacillus peoriae TaxID=59893 RepID=A0A7H0YHD6_9BACL|nr:hypothetical protein [Paenibacillus peoriae]QNR70494.1 hypothetical protein IAQ67_28710 [Paenibacillus peoriae]
MKAIGNFLSGIFGVITMALFIVTFLVFVVLSAAVFIAGFIIALPFILVNLLIRTIFRLDVKKALNLELIQKEFKKAGFKISRD